MLYLSLLLLGLFFFLMKFLFSYFIPKRKNKVDYSFGLPYAVEILKNIETKHFLLAEQQITQLSPNDLSIVMDHLGLNLEKSKLLEWQKNANDKSISNMVLGIYHVHYAWIARGYDFAKNTSDDKKMGFANHLKLAIEYFEQIPESFSMISEVYTRFIRIYMGFGYIDDATEYYHKTISIHPNKLYAHVQQSSVVQPKWGGNHTMIQNFIESLPNDWLIQQTVYLKLLYESEGAEENYFGGSLESLNQKTKAALQLVDNEIKFQKANAHFYMLYNYMMVLAESTKNKKLEDVYSKKVNGFYTLYPFGIQK